MKKPAIFLILLVLAVGTGYFFLNYEVQREEEGGRTAAWRIVPRQSGPQSEARKRIAAYPAVGSSSSIIRLATWQLGRLDEAKLSHQLSGEVLIRLLPQFDLIALQGVRGKNRGVLLRLVERLSEASGRMYDFAVCPTQQRDGVEHYCAFVFDATRLEVDRRTVRFVEDRLNRFRVKPLIGLFRVRGPAENEAFTFTLISAEVDPEQADLETDLLAQAYRAVRDDGRSEDDIILMGDFQRDTGHLGSLSRIPGLTPLLEDLPTTVRGTRLVDNILLDRRATSEFTGRVEVVDVMRQFELTLAAALEISEHLPIWAEFSVYEGGRSGRP